MTTNPRGDRPPSNDHELSEPGYESTRSLVEDLGEVADDLRQIGVDLGARPYTVHVVRVKWSGGEPGRGQPSIVQDIPIQPVPLVQGIGSQSRSLGSGGSTERGDITITEISPRYTEDELSGYFGLSDGEEGFFEVRVDERDGVTERRRYVLADTPERRPTLFDWKLVLRKQEGGRERNGTRRPVRDGLWK